MANGTLLRNAVTTACGVATATDRWLIKVEPGDYEIQNVPLQMCEWVDIEGSGRLQTKIIGVGPAVTAFETIRGADNAELRQLTVETTGAAHNTAVVGLYNDEASPRLLHVDFNTSGPTVNYGIWSKDGKPYLRTVEVRVTGGTDTYGVAYEGTLGTPIGQIWRSYIYAANGSGTNTAVHATGSIGAAILRHSMAVAVGGTEAYGLKSDSSGISTHELVDAKVVAQSASASNYAVYVDFETVMSHRSRILATGGATNIGVFVGAGHAETITLMDSEILGSTNTLLSMSAPATVNIGSTRLSGGPVVSAGTSAPVCAGVYDELFAFTAGPGCP